MSNTTIITGEAGGKHIVSGPVTTGVTKEASSELLRNEIDNRIVKIRPMSTPIDQLSRWAGARMSDSMEVEYYSVDTKPIEANLASEHIESDTLLDPNLPQQVTLFTDNDGIFEPSETILVPGINGYADDGVTVAGALVLYVISRIEGGGIVVIAANGKRVGNAMRCVPTIPRDTRLVRMGRAAAELDVQTAQYSALPVKSSNYCQIFKAQVEQSTIQKIANKEVGWNFSDQEEVAIIDMRLGMEKNFLFGTRSRVYDSVKRDWIQLTGGIWNQAGKEIKYAEGELNADKLVEISRYAFTENAGSSRKILIGGTQFIEALNKLEYTKVIMANEKVSRWGIDFSELHTKFGTLYVVHSEVFDQCGHASDAFVLDPEYLTKYSHIPFRTEKLDLKKSGVRNTDAIVITEASCLVLRYPQAHMRIVKQ